MSDLTINDMKKLIYSIIGLLILVALGAGWWWFFPHSVFFIPQSAAPPTAQLEPYTVPPLGETYTNEQYHFSLTLPEGFSAREMAPYAETTPGQARSTTIVLEDTQANGIQITITPFDEDLRVLTEVRVRQDVPDMAITNVQPVEVGLNHTGLAFKSDNPAFSGASREVWFVFRGNLYQISTYERLDNLLKEIFATWKFF